MKIVCTKLYSRIITPMIPYHCHHMGSVALSPEGRRFLSAAGIAEASNCRPAVAKNESSPSSVRADVDS